MHHFSLSFTIKYSYMANSNKLSGCHKMKQLLTLISSFLGSHKQQNTDSVFLQMLFSSI